MKKKSAGTSGLGLARLAWSFGTSATSEKLKRGVLAPPSSMISNKFLLGLLAINRLK